MMIENIKSIAVGLSVGIIFALFKLPIPAPSVLGGVLGVVSIYLGMVIVKFIVK